MCKIRATTAFSFSMRILGKLQCFHIGKHCSFPIGYFNNNKKKFLSRFTLLLLFYLSSLLFLPANHNLCTIFSSSIFSWTKQSCKHKFPNLIQISHKTTKTNISISPSCTGSREWGVVAEAHLVEEAWAALGDGGGLGDPERPTLISVAVWDGGVLVRSMG